MLYYLNKLYVVEVFIRRILVDNIPTARLIGVQRHKTYLYAAHPIQNLELTKGTYFFFSSALYEKSMYGGVDH
jgi:hypothetical protein